MMIDISEKILKVSAVDSELLAFACAGMVVATVISAFALYVLGKAEQEANKVVK
jgi:hypothetical protein